ncbi:MAG: 4Fe-4S dicluster domain-containing protein [Candidatus Binataceae bacterium]
MNLLDQLIYPFRRPKPPSRATAMGFFTDTSLCIGCKACEVACKQWNQIPADGMQWTGKSYDNTATLSATTWRHVHFVEQFADGNSAAAPNPSVLPPAGYSPAEPERSSMLELLLNQPKSGRWLMMSDVCKHCAEAPCQLACPTGAIIFNEFDNVYIQNDICNGCGYCVAACPFGVITRSVLDGHAHKCTLCFDRQRDGMVPACAKACPTESIQFGPVEDLRERARTRVETLHTRGQTDAWLYGDKPSARYPQLNSFFLLLDRAGLYGLPETPQLPQLQLLPDYARMTLGVLLTVAAIVLTFLSKTHGL